MSTASILTLTAANTISAGSPSTINLDWDVETQYLDADISFWEGVTNPWRLTLPGSLDGITCEVFLWVEDNVNDWGSGSGAYMGLLQSGLTGYNSWGIIRDMGYASRGVRTGPMRADADGSYFYTSGREFETHTLAPGTRSRFGIITDPKPRAFAAAKGIGYSTGSTEKNANFAEDFDFGDVYNPTTGVYTVPGGATLAAVDCTGYVTSSTGSRLNWSLDVDGTEIARYEAQHSLRGCGPGSFGLLPVTAGEEIVIRMADDAGTRTGNFEHSVEFY